MDLVDEIRDAPELQAWEFGRELSWGATGLEQAEGRTVGRGADVWSWGLVVLEMFAGGDEQRPQPGNEAQESQGQNDSPELNGNDGHEEPDT